MGLKYSLKIFFADRLRLENNPRIVRGLRQCRRNIECLETMSFHYFIAALPNTSPELRDAALRAVRMGLWLDHGQPGVDSIPD